MSFSYAKVSLQPIASAPAQPVFISGEFDEMLPSSQIVPRITYEVSLSTALAGADPDALDHTVNYVARHKGAAESIIDVSIDKVKVTWCHNSSPACLKNERKRGG
jgi:hypothetical protein